MDTITPAPRRTALRTWLILTALAVAALWYAAFVHTPPGPRSLRVFDADRVAELEVDMWQAYYAKENVRLFLDLVILHREEYHYSWARAAVAAYHFAKAAARFGNIRTGYEEVLPDLTTAYVIAREWTGAQFDPPTLARAELAWWVARRVPGQDSAEQVGQVMAQAYAMLYGAPVDQVTDAALLRARAAKLRDNGGDHADWPVVANMLRDSYRALLADLSRAS